MRATIEETGDGLVLRIPQDVADLLGFANGREVELTVAGGRLIVEAPRPDRLTFEERCARITDENRHGEIDTGPAVGKEPW